MVCPLFPLHNSMFCANILIGSILPKAPHIRQTPTTRPKSSKTRAISKTRYTRRNVITYRDVARIGCDYTMPWDWHIDRAAFDGIVLAFAIDWLGLITDQTERRVS